MTDDGLQEIVAGIAVMASVASGVGEMDPVDFPQEVITASSVADDVGIGDDDDDNGSDDDAPRKPRRPESVDDRDRPQRDQLQPTRLAFVEGTPFFLKMPSDREEEIGYLAHALSALTSRDGNILGLEVVVDEQSDGSKTAHIHSTMFETIAMALETLSIQLISIEERLARLEKQQREGG